MRRGSRPWVCETGNSNVKRGLSMWTRGDAGDRSAHLRAGLDALLPRGGFTTVAEVDGNGLRARSGRHRR